MDLLKPKGNKGPSPEQQRQEPSSEDTEERIEAFTPPSSAELFALESLARAQKALEGVPNGQEVDVELPTPVITDDVAALRADISMLKIEGRGNKALFKNIAGAIATVQCVVRPENSSEHIVISAD